jgi:putative transposase
MSRTIRTFEATITNQQQVCYNLDQLGWAASKLWNVGRYYAQEQWDGTGEIPDDGELKAELKSHERYTDLHSQSSQRVFEELAEAFNSWYGSDDDRDNPPGYRKNGDAHPRSTVSFKPAGFKHDAQFTRVRLSKGRNLKQHRSDFILCEYQTRPDVDLTEWDIQQVRAVYKLDEWRLQFVCRTIIDPEPPGDDVAGVDLGICNFAAVSFGGESVLYPGGALKEDEYYFTKKKAKCDDSSSREATRLDRTRTGRRTHFLHALSKVIVAECVERGVGTLVVGDLGGIREDDESGESRNWGDHGNLDLQENLVIGATTAILTCTGGRSTVSRRYSTTKRKPKASRLSKSLSAIRRSRVQCVVTQTRISALNADCTSVRSATRLRTRT